MKKSLAQVFGATAALVMVFGSGVASANNEYKGRTYGQAAETIKRGGGNVVIASRQGSYLPTEKCIVTGSRRGSFLDSSGHNRGYSVLLDLNCNAPSAVGSGHPGNSVTTPEGKEAMKWIARAEGINENLIKTTAAGESPICARDDATRKYCVLICERSGKCSAEMLDFLGL